MNTLTTTPVDWYAYAQKYDMLLAYNPFYQQAHQKVMKQVKNWSLRDGAVIADIGAGTGNYSVAAARLFPKAQVLHFDQDKGMNLMAAKKAEDLSNLQIIEKPVEQSDFTEGHLSGILCINALYTFPDPENTLRKMYRWLEPGGYLALVDAGRIMNLWSWKLAISWHMLWKHGLTKTLEIFREAKTVSQQNAYIRKMQKNGTYWTHSHEEFCAAVRNAGFTIEMSERCFRGDCDLVIARKN